MQKYCRIAAVIFAVTALAGCSGLDNTQQRMLTGGAIGAAAGVALTAATGGGNLLWGGLLGGAGGAAIGGLTH